MWNFIEASFASSRLWSDGAFEVPMLRDLFLLGDGRHRLPLYVASREHTLANPRMHFQLPTAQLRVVLAPRRGARRSSRPGTPRACCHHQLSSDVNAP